MVANVVARCLRVQQNVKTRFSAACVFSRRAREGGQGIVRGTVLKLDVLRAKVGGTLVFALGARRGLGPPSWTLVGRVAVTVLAVVVSDGGGDGSSQTSSIFRFRLRGS